MVDSDINLDLYKIPSIEILRNRRAFFDLWRRSDDRITTWLERVQNCIRRCEFPKFITDLLLIDRFICGLNANELESIQNVNKFWMLKQLLEQFSDGKVVSGGEHIKFGSAVEDKNTSLGVVKSEPNEEEWIQIGPPNQSPDEVDSLAEIKPNVIKDEYESVDDNIVSETEDTNSGQTLNKEEIDHDMLNEAMQFECEDYKFSVVDAVGVEEIDEENSQNDLDKNKGRQRERPFPCDQCDKAFNSAGNLKRHKMVHQQIRTHACEQCHERFFSSFDLKRHSRKHTGEGSACDECDKAFANSSNLLRHKKAFHLGIRSHACIECGKCFHLAQHLKDHLRIHTGEKPFACDECNKAFNQSNALKRHKKEIHQRIRPHVCKQCDKRFASAPNLKLHSRTHT